MAHEADNPYEASDESSENELLDQSLSVWKGWNVKEVFDPIPLDLHTASSIGQYDCVRSFISRKVDLNKKNRGGWTSLMYACYIGHDNIVNLLLDAGVNVNVQNLKGQTPLMLAASCGNESVGYFLCQQGADLEATDLKGWTALFHATYAGHQNMVRFLLEQGANINAVEPSLGMTPFMEAAAEGHEIIVQLFLQHGVNMDRKAYNNDTARSLALLHSNMKIVSLIDNHVMPKTCLRSEAGLDAIDLSSSYDKPKSVHGHPRGHKISRKGPSIQDGPDAIAELIDRTKVPKGYVTYQHTDGDTGASFSNRNLTSPINTQDSSMLDSSGGKDSVDNDNDEGGNAFLETNVLTIRSSSSSSGRPITALSSSHSSADSDDYQPQDSAPSSWDGSNHDLTESSGSLSDGGLSPASSYNKAMENMLLQDGPTHQQAENVPSTVQDKTSVDLLTVESSEEIAVKQQSGASGEAPKKDTVHNLPSAMSPTSQLKDRERQSNKSRSNSPSVKFNTHDIIVPHDFDSTQEEPFQQRAQIESHYPHPHQNQQKVKYERPHQQHRVQFEQQQHSQQQHVVQHSQQPQHRVHFEQQLQNQPHGLPFDQQGPPRVKSDQQSRVAGEQIPQQYSVPYEPPPQAILPEQQRQQQPNRVHFDQTPQNNINYDFPNGPTTDIPSGFPNIGANFAPQLGCQLFPANPGITDPPFFVPQKQDSSEYPNDLPTLLEQIGLTKYLKTFEEQDVDLQVFLSLTDNDLKEIGIKLFGPRKKMTNAIARWHSKAPLPSSNKLEQAYADRLEGEMQEMALQLHKSSEEVEAMRAEVMQEKQLRVVTEGCLNDERASRYNIQRVILESRQKYDEMRECLRSIIHHHLEIKIKLQCANDVSNTGKDDFSVEERYRAERSAIEMLVKKMEQQLNELQLSLTKVLTNSDRILGRTSTSQDGNYA